jgi:hypothetical protein
VDAPNAEELVDYRLDPFLGEDHGAAAEVRRQPAVLERRQRRDDLVRRRLTRRVVGGPRRELGGGLAMLLGVEPLLRVLV